MTTRTGRPELSPDGWPTPVRRVLGRLDESGFEAYLVGGCVRDRLLGRPLHDYDVATSATPAQVARLFEHTLSTGEKHGTVTVIESGIPVEVTTFRVDLGYSDGRHPDAVAFTTSIEADLARRDFTVNAIAVDRHGRVVDPHHGLTDAANHCLRAVGKPHERFGEDALRIVRALRFAAQLAFSIEAVTFAAMTDCAPSLSNIATERVGQEFARIAGANWPQILTGLADGPFLSVLPHPWPQLRRGFAKLSRRAWDRARWEAVTVSHTARVRALQAYAPERAQSCWFADTASASARSCLALTLWVIASELSPAVTRALCHRAAWPRDRTDRIVGAAAAAAAKPSSWDALGWQRGCYVHDAGDLMSACVCLDAIEGHETERTTRAGSMLAAAAEQRLWSRRELALNGRDLAKLGAHGPVIGQLLDLLVAGVLSGKIPNNIDSLREFSVQWLGRQREE